MKLTITPKYGYGILSLLGFVLAFLIYSSPMKSLVQNHDLVQQNKTYLNGIEQIDRDNLMLLTEIDGVITVLNSSEIGISFFVDAQIKIGHALSAFTRFVGDGLELTLVSLTITKGTVWLLEVCEFISPLLLSLCFLCVGIYNLLKYINIEKDTGQPYTKRVLEFTFVIFLSTYIIIPYTVYGTALVDKFVYTEFSKQKNESLKNLHGDVVSTNEKSSLKDKANADFKHFEKVMVHIPHKVDTMAKYHSEHFIYNIFRTIIMPGFMFFILYVLMCRHVLPAFMEKIFK